MLYLRNMQYDVFISYSRKDTKTAEAICEALSQAGISFFIDKEGIAGGANFPEVLARTIDSATVFLLVASENAYKSKFTKAEILYAFNHKRSGCILPYLIDDCPMPSDLEFLLGNVNWLYSKNCPVSELPKEVRKALDNPDSGTIAGRKVRKKWYLWLLVPIVLAAAAGVAKVIIDDQHRKIAQEAALQDRQRYERCIDAADSLIREAGMMGRAENAIETTAAQIAALKEAGSLLERSDSIKAVHARDEHIGLFSRSNSELYKKINEKLDSMHLAWTEYALDSWDLYKVTHSASEAGNTLDCIEHALSIKPNAQLESIKNKLAE